MRDRKYYIGMDHFERWVVVNCLNEIWNNPIAMSKYSDAVDEVLLKKRKADNQLARVGKMNNIRQRATVIVSTDLIYGR